MESRRRTRLAQVQDMATGGWVQGLPAKQKRNNVNQIHYCIHLGVWWIRDGSSFKKKKLAKPHKAEKKYYINNVNKYNLRTAVGVVGVDGAATWSADTLRTFRPAGTAAKCGKNEVRSARNGRYRKARNAVEQCCQRRRVTGYGSKIIVTVRFCVPGRIGAVHRAKTSSCCFRLPTRARRLTTVNIAVLLSRDNCECRTINKYLLYPNC